jgi:hypothetical protein
MEAVKEKSVGGSIADWKSGGGGEMLQCVNRHKPQQQ